MFDEEQPKRHKHQRSYTFLIVSDDPEGSTGSLRMGAVTTQLLSFAAFFAAVLLICLIVYSAMTIQGLRRVNLIQRSQLSTTSGEKELLTAENSSLEARVDQLTRSLSQKVIKEQNAEKEDEARHLPTGFPLTGTANMINTVDSQAAATIEAAIALLAEREKNSEVSDPEGDPILCFIGAAEDSFVVATGAGTIAEIAEDEKYGSRIVIDHGAGYRSIYRNAGKAVVREGDEVLRGSTLFVIGAENATVGYQITQDGAFINPETLTEIDG